MPEKNIGDVSTTTVASLAQRRRAEAAAPRHQRARRRGSPAAAGTAPAAAGSSIARTTRLARKAIARIPPMTMPMTCQVLPKARPSSVMPLVSTSMKPAPRRKYGRLPTVGRSLKLAMRSSDSASTMPIMTEVGHADTCAAACRRTASRRSRGRPGWRDRRTASCTPGSPSSLEHVRPAGRTLAAARLEEGHRVVVSALDALGGWPSNASCEHQVDLAPHVPGDDRERQRQDARRP